MTYPQQSESLVDVEIETNSGNVLVAVENEFVTLTTPSGTVEFTSDQAGVVADALREAGDIAEQALDELDDEDVAVVNPESWRKPSPNRIRYTLTQAYMKGQLPNWRFEQEGDGWVQLRKTTEDRWERYGSEVFPSREAALATAMEVVRSGG